jgi:pimeloyl-ACP methyl ester carboxylesterase
VTITYLQHNRIRLALHALRGASGEAGARMRPLLLLHGLGERAPQHAPVELVRWLGPIYALDFTGHGASTVPHGGGYTCEILMADADAALAHLGPCTLMGRGLGAYIALLAAGGRPQLVRGAILRDGPGLAGGGAGASTPFVPYVDASRPAPPDPFALVELAVDIRPPDYACVFARQAAQLSGLSRPLSVCASERPSWLAAVTAELGVESTNVREALDYYAQHASS